VVVDGSTQTEYRPDHLGSPDASGTIVSSDDFTIEPAAVQRLVEQGVVALDMETGAVAAVCTERGCAWSVIRSISDMATDHPDDAVLGLAKPDGSPDAGAAAKFLLTHPGRIPKLVRLARGAKLAATNAARAAANACANA
jgi:adenosylhomocysteine nucleosidase